MSAESAIGEFCAAMGLPSQPPPLTLDFERSGQLHLEQRDRFAIVYLARTIPLYRTGIAAAALRAVHPDRCLPFVVRAAFHADETFILLVRLTEEQVDLPTLDALGQLLMRLADQVEAEAR